MYVYPYVYIYNVCMNHSKIFNQLYMNHLMELDIYMDIVGRHGIWWYVCIYIYLYSPQDDFGFVPFMGFKEANCWIERIYLYS